MWMWHDTFYRNVNMVPSLPHTNVKVFTIYLCIVTGDNSKKTGSYISLDVLVPWLKFTSKPRFAVTNKKWQIYMSCLLLSTENILSTPEISLGTVRVSSGGKGGGMKGRSWLVQGRSGGHVNLLALRVTTQSHANTHIQYPQETPDCECM